MNYKFKPSHIVPAYLFIVAVLYGGSKPPASTNTPPDSISGDSTNDVAIIAGDLTNSVPDDASSPTNQPPPVLMARRLPSVALAKDGPRLVLSAPPQQTEPSFLCSPSPSTFTSLTAWNKRGAYCDWLHITFPDGFAFPSGTNLLTGVTLMAYGEVVGRGLRSAPETESTNSIPAARGLAALPMRVSLEPDASSFSYGLTASNSFLFAWQNVCVNRSPTNRVDASIELFQSGDIQIITTPLSSPSPSTFAYQPAIPPAGFVGQGQDTAWLAANFSPTDYAAITNKGYARWLDEDYVGYNEENGHCRGTVTVPAMPPNGQPCYLVCGPYKIVVTEPGDYDFPVEVLTDIHIRTYPTSVPVSFSYDEGYYPDEDDYGPLNQSNNPNNLNNPNNPLLLGSPQPPTEIFACIIPSLHLTPSYISFSEMVNRHVRIWCNMTQAAWEYVTLGAEEATVRFHNRHDAEVLDWMSTRLARILIYNRNHPEVYGYLHIIPPYIPENNPDPTNDCDNGNSPTNPPPSGTTP